MSFIVSVENYNLKNYISEGTNYTVASESYVPFTDNKKKARRYRTYAGAVRATKREGVNMYGHIEIEEVEDGNDD